MIGRRLGPALLAVLVAVGMLAIPAGPTGPADVRAATPDLTITGDALYDVQPDKQRVRVTVDLTMVNHLKDTKTKRYFFDEAYLDVMPKSSAFRLTRDGSGSPSVKVTKRTDAYTRLRLRYPRLYSGKTAKYRLTFDLKDPGGDAVRELRVGDTLVSFPVWAFATDSTPGGSVTVRFPAGYDVKVEAGSLPEPSTDAEGRTVFRTGKLTSPLSFFAYLVADRPGAFTERAVAANVLGDSTTVVVRSWEDDAPWGDRVAELVGAALPELGERIGIAWPHEGSLVVQEAVSRSADGYAGLFDPGRGLVEIAYYADDFVILHEAAHGWFNGALLADRWANEAFASYYAAIIAPDLDVRARDDGLTEELRASAIPLNDWGPVGSVPIAQEDFAYAAAHGLARAIADRAGDDGLRAVWTDAARGIGAYQPPAGEAERVDGPPDWRGLLDLLEARTGASYDDLWRTWVARPGDVALLDARAAARDRYAAVLSQAADWRLPRPIRDALRAWQFDDATALLDQAASALEARGHVEEAAAEAGLIAPVGLRLAFEDDDGFDDAEAEATAELAAITYYTEAVALRPSDPDPFVQLGLWGETPEADLVAARDALARGELQDSAAASTQAAATWAEAQAVGQGRAFSIALLALAALLAVLLLVATLRRWRSGRRRPMTMTESAAGE